LGGALLGGGEAQREGRTEAHLTRDRDRSPELLDHFLRDCETKTEALFLGGDEVIEDSAEPLRRDKTLK